MASPGFNNFVKNKQGAGNNNTTPGFQNYLQGKSNPAINKAAPATTQTATKTVTPSKDNAKTNETKWQWFTKQLMKPVGVASEALETVGKTAGALILPAISKKVTVKEGAGMALQELKQGAIDIKNVATGKKITSYYTKLTEDQKIREARGEKISTGEKVLMNTFGIGADLILDPLNFVSPAKVLKKVGEVTKLNKPLAAASKVASETLKNIPVSGTKNVGEVGKEIKSLFTNATGNKEFDDIVTKFRNLRAYRDGQSFDQAVQLQKDINSIAKVQGKDPIVIQKTIRDALENKNIYDNLGTQLKDEVDILKATYKTALSDAKNAGLSIKEIAEYAPRIRTKESFVNKLQTMYGGAKEFNKGSIEQGRKAFIDVIDDAGDVVSGKPADLGLKKINKESFISAIEDKAAKKIDKLQSSLNNLTKNDVKAATQDLEDLVKTLRINTSKETKIGSIVDNAIIEPTKDELDNIINGLIGERRDELTTLIGKLKEESSLSQGLEFNKPVLGTKISKNAEAFSRFSKIRTEIKESMGIDYDRAIANGDLAREQIYKNGKIFTAEAAKGRVDDIAMKLDDWYKGLGDKFRKVVGTGEMTLDDLEKAGIKILDDAKQNTFGVADDLSKYKKVRIKQLSDEIVKTQNDIAKNIEKIQGFEFFGKGGKLYNTKMMTQSAIENLNGGKYANFFESNPAVQLAAKGQAYSKAITAKEFANEVVKFATDDGVEVANSLFKGQKFAPEVAKVIDNFYTSIKPEELNIVYKGFDAVQNLWKAQVLVSPSYHLRNVAGNLWNNYLAGVYNPKFYAEATQIQKNPTKFAGITDELKRFNVLKQGQYGADIPTQIKSIGNKTIVQKLNPLSRENSLLTLNKNVGSALEDNAKIAHYLAKKAAGFDAAAAAQSVKKFLFDYDDLTKFEKTVLKRAAPFYTWTRKNIPLQLGNMIEQPGKYANVAKVQNIIESGVKEPNEKFMGSYIKDNIPVRFRKNDKGDTEYFLLGNWLPAAQAIDFLSQPFDNMINMLSPIPKSIYENLSGKSLYFKTTTGEQQPISGETEFLGKSIDSQAANLIKNIRVLGDINKWIDKNGKTETQDSWQVKGLNTLFGKSATYDVGKSKYFYDKDTKDKITEYESSIRQALKNGDKDRAKKLKGDLKDFVKERSLK